MKVQFYKFILLIPLFILMGCSSGGTSKNIFLDGTILNFQSLGQEIEVKVIEDGRTRDSDKVDETGAFGLNFNSSTGIVALRFEGDNFTVERQNFGVTDDSTIDLDVTLQTNPIQIIFESWVVFQDRISIGSDNIVSLIESQVVLILNGDGKTCIKTVSDSVVDFRVGSIDISNCSEAVRTEGASSVILLADGAITIFSEKDTIRSKNESNVNIGETLNPTNNSVLVRSFDNNGVNASGSAVVVFTPQNNNCTIQGADSAVVSQPGTVVDTDGCTLVDG